MKFNNKKTTVHNTVFDSKMESDYFLYLLDQQEEGKIALFELQPVYSLLPSFKKNKHTIRRIDYIADFLVTHLDGSQVVVDVKGVSTDVFRIKAKLFDYFYPHLELKVITLYKGEWIELSKKPKGKGGVKRVRRNRRL